MPAVWVKDENIWKKAKDQYKKQYGHKPKDQYEWAIVAEIYERMGGRKKESIKTMYEKYVLNYDTMHYMEFHKIVIGKQYNYNFLKQVYDLLENPRRKMLIRNLLIDAQDFRESYDSEMVIGMEVEKEHKPTYEFIKNYLEENGELPSETEVYHNIAQDHLNEFANYYTALQQMEEDLSNEEK